MYKYSIFSDFVFKFFFFIVVGSSEEKEVAQKVIFDSGKHKYTAKRWKDGED